jgi:hypothetical protein
MKTMGISADAWSNIPSWTPEEGYFKDENERKNNAKELINRRSNLGYRGGRWPGSGEILTSTCEGMMHRNKVKS